MTLPLPIFLASGNDSTLDFVIWIVAAAAWLIAQVSAVKRKQEKQLHQSRRAPSAPAGAPPAAGESPTPDELTDIFRRLGVNIPNTPPPAPASAPRAGPRPVPRKTIQRVPLRKAAAPVAPELADRLARAKQAVEEAARDAEAAARPAAPFLQGVVSQKDDSRSINSATHHSRMILPRIHAMDLRLAPLPVLALPGIDRTHHTGKPLRARLHARREIRDALVIQSFLRSPKAFNP